MRPKALPILLGLALAVAACSAGAERRQWMKVSEEYTTAEFRRDHAECSTRGRLDEACMRARGWVDVTEIKTKTPEPEPHYQLPPRLGR